MTALGRHFCVFVFKNHGLKSVMLKNGFYKTIFKKLWRISETKLFLLLF